MTHRTLQKFRSFTALCVLFAITEYAISLACYQYDIHAAMIVGALGVFFAILGLITSWIPLVAAYRARREYDGGEYLDPL